MDPAFKIILSLIFSAFFSGMEIAFVSSNRLKIELEKNQGNRISKIVSIFTSNPSRYIATMLVGNNVALVVYGIYMGEEIINIGVQIYKTYNLLPWLFEFIAQSKTTILTIQTVISTLIILITAEFLPKTIFRINPNRVLNLFAIPVLCFYVILYPVVVFTLWISNLLLKKFAKISLSEKEENIVFKKIDLDHFVSLAQDVDEENTEIEHEIKIFQNALDFSNVKLRECIVPRTEIVALDVNDSIENLKNNFIEFGVSKILIYKENIDNVIGFVHSSDLFKNPQSIKSMLRDIPIVPETMPANKLLSTFIKENKSIAVVVDEFGGTSGMVTIEDVMEEIFGEIEDEHDIVDIIDKKISDTEFVFSARAEIDYLNEKYKLDLPESEEYETLGGLILYSHESIPLQNDVIVIDSLEFKILKVTSTRIELVNLKLINQD